MLNRRSLIVGASSFIAAPAVVLCASLMPVRGVIVPVRSNHYGFTDRLRIDHRFRRGDLDGHALAIAVQAGRLKRHGLMPQGPIV